MSNSGFRLRNLNISGHPVLKDVCFVFCDDDNAPDSVYVTGIIGANGTGKSHLMAAVASIFSEINRAQVNGNNGKRRFTFDVAYDLLNDSYMISNSHKSGYGVDDWYHRRQGYISAYKNGLSVDLNDVFLPNGIIASTMTVTDKFLAKSDDFYKYRGIRNEKAASMTGTRTIIRKTVSSIMDCMSSKSAFQQEMQILLDNLELERHLYIKYGMRYKHLFLKSDMTVEMFRNIFDNWQTYFRGRSQAPWGYNYYLKICDDYDRLECVVSFLTRHSDNSQNAVVARYDVMEAPGEFQRDAEAIRILSQLDLISFPSVEVVKKGASYGLENSSSGETHLLCQFIGIMAEIRHDSLILIDEPENSSHPDWQMSYVGWLKDIFKDYHDCHFIITTHSPLLLANMKPSESTIIKLKRNQSGRIVSEGELENGCYSWTVDEILRDVMEIRKSHPDDYNVAMSDFENALRNNCRQMARNAYDRLKGMINPNNVLLELLRIQMIGLDDD